MTPAPTTRRGFGAALLSSAALAQPAPPRVIDAHTHLPFRLEPGPIDADRMLIDAAAKLGIRLALETHNNYLHDLVPACRKLMDMTNHPAVGLNFDQGNIALNPKGGTVDSFFEALSDKVYYAHLKNVQVVRGKNGGGYFITRLEEGCINQRRVMQLLKKHLQGGVIAIEYPCPGDSFTAAKRDMNYLRELLAEI